MQKRQGAKNAGRAWPALHFFPSFRGVFAALREILIIPSSVSAATKQIANLLIINNILTENRKLHKTG
ncbi:MAG: hypothetical protein FJ126_12960 [Deltaproteobacteria bacterium]|nr:hypothetical protein [Deltaproteobacteria bacterium]